MGVGVVKWYIPQMTLTIISDMRACGYHKPQPVENRTTNACEPAVCAAVQFHMFLRESKSSSILDDM